MAPAVITEFSFRNVREQQLFGIEVMPPKGDPKCVCIWAHGHGEHCRRKLKVFQAWADEGIAVFSFDAASMGASEPLEPRQRHLVQSFGHLVDDMADFAAFTARKHKRLDGLPWFAAGYSIGGTTAALAVLRWQEQWAGLALFAPAAGVHLTLMTRIQKFFGPCLDTTLPRAKICQPVNAESLNPDPDVVAAYKADPLCVSGPTRIRTAFQYSKGMDVLEQSAPQITIPLYCEHSKGDVIARWEDSQELCASVGSDDVTWVVQEGGCHDELSGEHAMEVAARMAAWMLKKAAEWTAAKEAGGKKATGGSDGGDDLRRRVD